MTDDGVFFCDNLKGFLRAILTVGMRDLGTKQHIQTLNENTAW